MIVCVCACSIRVARGSRYHMKNMCQVPFPTAAVKMGIKNPPSMQVEGKVTAARRKVTLMVAKDSWLWHKIGRF